jgi:hypothetical protein
MLRMRDAQGFLGTCARPSELTRAAPAATPADAAYALGDFASAAREYRTQVDTDPDNRYGWAGLALATRRLGDTAADLWRSRPELPYAVHRAVRRAGGSAPDPIALARWLAAGAVPVDQVGGGSTTQ